jgi:hypothetical protein
VEVNGIEGTDSEKMRIILDESITRIFAKHI